MGETGDRMKHLGINLQEQERNRGGGCSAQWKSAFSFRAFTCGQ